MECSKPVGHVPGELHEVDFPPSDHPYPPLRERQHRRATRTGASLKLAERWAATDAQERRRMNVSVEYFGVGLSQCLDGLRLVRRELLTAAVSRRHYGASHEFPAPLDVDSLLHCPHGYRWHPVIQGHTEGTSYTQAMLYFVCPGGRYYAGQSGQTSRHSTRNRHAAPQ
jgi:hypothetical protein